MGKTKSIVTEHEKMCFFCGRPAECEHHLLFGERVHDNPMAEKLSKILGQAVYEAKIGSREEFRARYGKSYL